MTPAVRLHLTQTQQPGLPTPAVIALMAPEEGTDHDVTSGVAASG